EASSTATTTASSRTPCTSSTVTSRSTRPRSTAATSSGASTTATPTGRSSGNTTRAGACLICTTSVCGEGDVMALASIFEKIVGTDAGVAFMAYDGSNAGPDGADITIEVKSPIAVAYLAQAPGELGLARAYVSGHIDVHGDLYTLLDRMWNITTNDLTTAEKIAAVRSLGLKPLLMRVPLPPQ